MNSTHVTQWQKASYEKRDALYDAWLAQSLWKTTMNGQVFAGKLIEINNFDEPLFTIEFNDPDDPRWIVTLARHFAQFEPVSVEDQ